MFKNIFKRVREKDKIKKQKLLYKISYINEKIDFNPYTKLLFYEGLDLNIEEYLTILKVVNKKKLNNEIVKFNTSMPLVIKNKKISDFFTVEGNYIINFEEMWKLLCKESEYFINWIVSVNVRKHNTIQSVNYRKLVNLYYTLNNICDNIIETHLPD